MAHLTVPAEPAVRKEVIRQYWEAEPCGTRGVPSEDRRRFFDQIERERYEWEPYIPPFARFHEGRGKKLLEIGVGAGTDFTNWVRNGAIATGVDLTQHAVSLTRERLALEGLTADVRQADAEHLPFENNSFDIVYSLGVLHTPPNPPKVHRGSVSRTQARRDVPRAHLQFELLGRLHALGDALSCQGSAVEKPAVGDSQLSRKPWG